MPLSFICLAAATALRQAEPRWGRYDLVVILHLPIPYKFQAPFPGGKRNWVLPHFLLSALKGGAPCQAGLGGSPSLERREAELGTPAAGQGERRRAVWLKRATAHLLWLLQRLLQPRGGQHQSHVQGPLVSLAFEVCWF